MVSLEDVACKRFKQVGNLLLGICMYLLQKRPIMNWYRKKDISGGYVINERMKILARQLGDEGRLHTCY